MDERRKWVRTSCELLCRYARGMGERVSDASLSPAPALIRDLSEGGLRLKIFEFVPVGRHLHILLEIPHREPLETSLEVLWVRELRGSDRYEIGGRFEGLGEDQRDELRQFICGQFERRAA